MSTRPTEHGGTRQYPSTREMVGPSSRQPSHGSGPSERETSLRRARRRLARVSRRQFGVFTVSQAIAVGFTRAVIYRDVERGRYLKLWPGVLAVAGTPDGREPRWMAALLLIAGDAALSHGTAASIHGFDHRPADNSIHLTVSTRHPPSRDGLVIHRSATLAADGVTTIGPLQVTSMTRTLCDLAAEVDAQRLRGLVAAAVRSGKTSADRLREAIARRRRFHGRTALRRIVDELSPLETLTRSELESLFVRITTAAGIPPTALNVRVVDANGDVRYLDAVYLPEGVVIELDSLEHHGTLLDWHDDLRRENALALAGTRVWLRFSYADLRDRPDEVVDTIRRALEQARRQPAHPRP